VDYPPWPTQPGATTWRSPRDVVGAEGFGQQAVMADAVESVWQHMDQETADELVGCERHHLVSIAAFDPVVLPLESNGLVVECDQAAVGDGDAVGVALEIGQHCLGSAEGTLRSMADITFNWSRLTWPALA